MSISKGIESKYFSDIESGHHKARTESLPFFTRLVEDLTLSEITKCFYKDEDEILVFSLLNYDKVLVINIFADSLQACTRDIVEQTHAFLCNNKRI